MRTRPVAAAIPRSGPSPVATAAAVVLGAGALVALVLGWLAATPPAAEAQSSVKTLQPGDCATGCTIPAGEIWQFPPSQSLTITPTGNVVVRGTLRMRPASPGVKHTLKFTGIDEGEFVGGGAQVLQSDTGLWVMGAGKLDVVGSEKVAWSTRWEPGWKAGDVIKAAPHRKGKYGGWKEVNGPAGVPSANALGYKTELLNLTRNVKIQGTASGKAHIFIHSSSKQTVKYALLRHLAPDFLPQDDKTGRYALHFHLSGDGSRGSVVEGVVVRDADGHAFVPHGSHGVTFRDTIAFDTTGEAYWWDESTGDSCPQNDEDCNATDDTKYFCAIAAKTKSHSSSPHTSAAFQLGAGKNNTVRDSVAVGMQGDGQNNSGFQWPSKDHGVWVFEDNVAHNNDANGIFVWQNTTGLPSGNHVIDGFDAYFNQKAGVDHGAYHNSYQYTDLDLRGNAVAIESHALGKASSDGSAWSQQWNRVMAGNRDLSVMLHNVLNKKARPARFVNCGFGDIEFNEIGARGGGERGLYDFVDCGVTPGTLDLDGAHPETVIRIQKLNGKAWRVEGDGSVRSIPAFATAGNFRYDELTASGGFGRKVRQGKWYAPGWDDIATPDLDGDGDDEILFYRRYDGRMKIHELKADATLGKRIRTATWGKWWSSVATPDLDGDGDDELLLYRKGSGRFRYFELNAKGQRGKLIRDDHYAENRTEVETPDLDGDGDDELLLYRASSGVYRLHELHRLGAKGRLVRSGKFGTWSAIATPDLDGDGDDEIVRYRKVAGRYRVNELTAAGRLGASKRNVKISKGWDTITAPHLDRDGDDELLRYR